MSWAEIAARNRPSVKPAVNIPQIQVVTKLEQTKTPPPVDAFPVLGSINISQIKTSWGPKPLQNKKLCEEFAALQTKPNNGWNTPIPLVSYPSVDSTFSGFTSVDEVSTPLPSAFGAFSPPSIYRTDSSLTIPAAGETSYLDFDSHIPLVNVLPDRDSTLLDDVAVKDTRISDSLKQLIAQASGLSKECFSECAVHRTSKKSGWKMALLISPCETALFGFLAYRLKASTTCLEIGKLAIAEPYRKYGFGRKLMRHIISIAKKHPEIGYVTLSALPEAIPFYKKLGFSADEGVKYSRVNLEAGEELVEGQVYMELFVGGIRKKKAVVSKR